MKTMMRWMMPVVLGLVLRAHGADVPQLINYQGYLEDNGSAVNGSVTLALKLYNVASGGAPLYVDSSSVTVSDGLYATLIGDHTISGTLTNALDNTAVWVEVEVNGTTLTPRERLVASAYAIRSAPRVSFRVQSDAGQAVTPSLVKVDFTSAVHNDGNAFSLATDTFTAPADGVYSFQFGILPFYGSAPRITVAGIYVNGIVVAESYADGGTGGPYNSATCNVTLSLNAGDQVQARVRSNGSTGNLVGSTWNWFSGFQVY